MNEHFQPDDRKDKAGGRWAGGRVRKLHRVGARSLDLYSGGRSGECVGTDAAQNARFVRVACTGTCYRYYP